jgi:hypothetical protein
VPARRLGFFARLFGRRRAARRVQEGSEPHTAQLAEDGGSDPAPAEERVAASVEVPSCVAEEAHVPDEDLTLAAEVALVEQELDARPERELELAPAPAQASPYATVPLTPSTPAATSASEAADRLEPDGAVDRAPSDAQASIEAELERAEEAAEEQVTAVLTGVLDRLGAAHHRPFSRA